jgi:predicted transposase YdaD
MIDHDRLFKELLTTFFWEFIELFLPGIAAYLERDSVQFLDKEVFTDVTAGERYEADLIVRARFQEQDSFFLIHVEHQAQNQAQFGKRMFRYFARLSEKYDLPVYPIALFSYNTPRRPERNSYQIEFPRAEIATIEPAEQEAVMQIVTSWMRQGIEQGLQQGLQQGRQEGLEQGRREGELALILRLLARRFGLIDPELEERIRQLSLPQLEGLAEALLEFSDQTDLVIWLQQVSDELDTGEGAVMSDDN